MNILFIGDVVGELGQRAIDNILPLVKKKYSIQLTIANGENIAQGFGINEKLYKWLLQAGIDVVTLGNHTFSNASAKHFIHDAKVLIRPYNLPFDTPGKGVHYVKVNNYELAVINLLGNAFMEESGNAFECVSRLIPKVRKRTKNILIDFHAESTSEKESLGFYLDGKVSAVLGTHTHVQTNDARILPKGTAYITDVGRTGSLDSAIGFQADLVARRFLGEKVKIKQELNGDYVLSACLIQIDSKTGLSKSIDNLFITNNNLTKLM